MTLPRVLLVDDDDAIRRFVELALEDLGISLQCVGSVPEALALLAAEGPVALLMTDLMMPGASGTELLQALADAPALRGAARLVVFSAGVDAVDPERLRALGVWRKLSKPVALADLLGCVQAALDDVHSAEVQAACEPQRAGTCADGGVPAPAETGADLGADAGGATAAAGGLGVLPADQRDAMLLHFGGDLALFGVYHASCVNQFAQDAAQGDAAVAAADMAALRRVAHNLKSVLSTLGYGALSGAARALEDACAAGDWPEVLPMWPALRSPLLAIQHLPAETAKSARSAGKIA